MGPPAACSNIQAVLQELLHAGMLLTVQVRAHGVTLRVWMRCHPSVVLLAIICNMDSDGQEVVIVQRISSGQKCIA
jgi:hypothetical protein